MPLSKEEMRLAMGSFATGLAVVTLSTEHGPWGMTANSLTSVALEPALLLVCIAQSAHTYTLMQRTEHFAINVLAERQGPLADRFAGAHHQLAQPFEDLAWRPSPLGQPWLAETVLNLDCRLMAQHPAADHVIVVAEAMGMHRDLSARPLLYYRGQLGKLRPQFEETASQKPLTWIEEAI